ncbi:MAG: hypothetical protein APF81_27395 [Desulfosporosinus sp. BRH_c37]|nr:MAG: hypothetical protein APF81_27395 [Desulfosporosinus sp. BRH_c37]
MQAKAIEKIQSEMTKDTANSYVQVVGGFLLQHLRQNPQDAEKILTADKTIGKSLGEMRKAAEKKKVGNCAVLTDPEGFAVVLNYFGVNSAADTQYRAAPALIPLVKPESDINFDIKLEDLF